jgi:hypothetical protein
MHRYFLSIGAFLVLAAALAVALVAGGCGGASASEITVQTGSLSKAEFIKRADAICTAARSQFTREYTAFVKKNYKPTSSRSAQEAVANELVESILLPNFEKPIDEISALGAPKGDEQAIASFLNALQQRLEEIHERPLILNKTVTPLARAEKLARAYGLTGCAESFS